MSYSVKTIAVFERQAKKLVKKYPSLKNELKVLIQQLKENPAQGTGIGKQCYKVRLAIKSKGQGKSGGARVITCIIIAEEQVYLLSVYDKSDQETILDTEIERLLNLIP